MDIVSDHLFNTTFDYSHNEWEKEEVVEGSNKEPPSAKEQDQDVENQVRKLDVHAAAVEKDQDEPMRSEHPTPQEDQVTETSQAAPAKSTSSWRPAFNLANIIEILRAPFVRNNNQQQQ